jgi:hypothetical protein
VLEVGIGSGLNILRYSADVQQVIGLEPSPKLLNMARRLGRCSFPVDLIEGALQRRREVEACKRAGFTPGNAGERRSDAVHAGLIGMAGRALRLIDFLAGVDIFASEGSAGRYGRCETDFASDHWA